MIPASVLVPIFRGEDGGTGLLLVRRAAGGIHGGQLAFPGGKQDPGDASLLDTALREVFEEIGLAREAITILEQLPTLETQTSRFSITPFLARIVPARPWRSHEAEIAEVLEVPVADLALPDAHGEAIEAFPTWKEPQRITFYRVGPYRLWGASYRILRPILPRLTTGHWEL